MPDRTSTDGPRHISHGRLSIPLHQDLGPHSAPPTPCPESEARSWNRSTLQSMPLETPRLAYLRRKSSEVANPGHRRQISLPRFIGTLLSAGADSGANTSSESSESEEGSGAASDNRDRPPFRRHETPAFETVYGSNDTTPGDVPLASASQSISQGLTGHIYFSGTGTFTFSEPQLSTEQTSSNATLSNSIDVLSELFRSENGSSWTEICDAFRLQSRLERNTAEQQHNGQTQESPSLSNAYQSMAKIFGAVWGIKSMSDTADTDHCSAAEISSPRPAQTVRARSWQSTAMSLPSEIIHQVCIYLHPRDFNAARHTCSTWMHASLNQRILCVMLQRGAWWSGFEHQSHQKLRMPNESLSMSPRDLWFMSCYISRECALAGGWTGNGLSRINHAAMATCDHHHGLCQKPSCWASRRSFTDPKVFRQVSRTHFGDLATGYNKRGRNRGLVFTASSCGNYLLVAEAGMIYVYEMFGDSIRTLTSVICPRTVLAMSIDASPRRFAIAALLEGRMGLMCSLRVGLRNDGDFNGLSSDTLAENSAGHRHSPVSATFQIILDSEGWQLTLSKVATAVRLRDFPSRRSTEVFEIRSEGDTETIQDDHTDLGREAAHINQAWDLHIPCIDLRSRVTGKEATRSTPIETGPRSLYHQLCAEDDPPRSVAICPQRQCVAFGCSAGLELHWIDALTGQDLNRWFPLTGPSDHLYFLPPRPGVDSPRKLRLISSAAHPNQRAAIARKFAASRIHADTAMTNSFWGSIGFENRMPSIAGFVSDCDHYRAVPMSDGFHILFADPDTGILCLGSDAPVGDPRRLLRKIMFVPPTEGAIPRLYTSSTDTSNGPKIAVAYDDEIFLYSVPSDAFDLSLREQRPGGTTTADRVTASTWLAWWPKDDIPANCLLPSTTPEPDAGPQSTWPLFVRGAHVGSLKFLVELSINAASGLLSIWAFGADGEAIVWQIDDGAHSQSIKEHNVARDGYVMDSYEIDFDGDVVMGDAEDLESPIESSSDPQIDGGSTGFEIQDEYDKERLRGRWDLYFSDETWFPDEGGKFPMEEPVELNTGIVDDVDA